ncbi:MAG: M16 family metallopeptidase [Elainellaceae cyanobacterium]
MMKLGMQKTPVKRPHHPRLRLSRLWRYGAISLVVVLLILGLGRQPALATQALHYTELEFSPLPELQIPEYETFQLDNGLQVYLMEDHELPLIGGTALIHTGDRYEPADKVGLAGIVGTVMRSGGTETYPADALNQFLEQRAASLETGIGLDSGSATFSALSEDLPEVFTRFADVLRHPAFPQDKIDFTVAQIEGGIARRNDNPDDILSREFDKLVYGSDSPYARTVEYSTLGNITRADIVDFYNAYFYPSNMLLGISGDFEPAEMRQMVEAAFGDWSTGGAEPLPAEPEVSQAQTSGIFVVDQPQLSQSYIQLGHLGGTLRGPGYAEMSVVNEVLNGLGGRLVNEVRSRQGLAYTTYAFWAARYDHPGIFIAGGQTRSDATVPFIQLTLAEIERIRQEPITPEELAQAKDSVLNSFVFNFQTPSQTLSRVMRYDYYDYPSDFIFQYRQDLQAVTADSVQQVAFEQLNPDQLVTLVVGNQAEIDPPLQSLNPDSVTPIDIALSPQSPSEASAN